MYALFFFLYVFRLPGHKHVRISTYTVSHIVQTFHQKRRGIITDSAVQVQNISSHISKYDIKWETIFIVFRLKFRTTLLVGSSHCWPYIVYINNTVTKRTCFRTQMLWSPWQIGIIVSETRSLVSHSRI